jgi:heat shock protein HtpX
MKTMRTTLLMAGLTVLFVLVGRAVGGNGGMVIAFLFAVITNVGAYWFSDKIAMAMSGAKQVEPEDAPELHRIVDEVAMYARLPKPRVYVVESPQPNAFATGRDPNHAAIAVTTGIMNLLDRRELTAVLAHELGHVKNRDVLVSTIAATFAGAITMLAHMAQWAMIFGGFGGRDDEEGSGMGSLVGGLLMIILAPIAAMLIQFAISRAREFGADETGAQIVGDPLALASALAKIDRGVQLVPREVNPATAHLYIMNPLHGGFSGLFSTHPPTEQRIARLEKMAGVRAR